MIDKEKSLAYRFPELAKEWHPTKNGVLTPSDITYMTFILIEDEQKCNFCVYWTGMRKKAEDFVYVDLESAEWGMCLHPEERHNGRPTASCEGCSRCKNTKTMLSDPYDT